MKKELLKIAKEYNYAIECRGDLEYRYNDDEDFIELSVGGIQAMLEAAYELGKKNAKQKKENKND